MALDIEKRAQLLAEYGGGGGPCPAPETAPSVAVIISSRNEGPRVRATVDCFRRAEGIPLETIVVDDASTDKSCAALPGHVIRRDSQCGVGANLNVGARLALALGADVLIFSDAHVRASGALLRAVAGKCIEAPAIVSPAARGYAANAVAGFGGALVRSACGEISPGPGGRDLVTVTWAPAPPVNDWGRVTAPLGGLYCMSAETARILAEPTGRIFDTHAGHYGCIEECLAIKAHFLAVPVFCYRGETHEHLFLVPGKGGGTGRWENLVYVLALYFSPEVFEERFRAGAEALLSAEAVDALCARADGKCRRTWTPADERAFLDALPEG